MTGNSSHRPFAGFPTPNYTPVPDTLFDKLLPVLSNSELRVILYAIRRIYGWRKEEDWITLSQFVSGVTRKDGTPLDKGCGLSRQGVVNGLRQAVANGYLLKRVICGHCENEITDREMVTRTVGGPGKQKRREVEVVPKRCPFCHNPFRGSSKALHYCYRLRLVNEVDQNQSTTLTRTSQRGRPELVNEVDPQQTIQTLTNNSNNAAATTTYGSGSRLDRHIHAELPKVFLDVAIIRRGTARHWEPGQSGAPRKKWSWQSRIERSSATDVS